jgi:endonuclease YncB( thermonuclease family)
MEERGTKFSLMVTGIFLLGLLILAALLRPDRKPETTPEASATTVQTATNKPVVGTAQPAATLGSQHMLPPPARGAGAAPFQRSGQHLEQGPSVPEEKARQQILTECRLKDDHSNDGDSFSVLTRSGEYRFALYYVDAPDTNGGSVEQLQSHSGYFGNLTEQNLRNLARESKEYVRQILANRKFDVVTRWERAPEESPNQEITARAFIFLDSTNGEKVSLSTLLVHEGLATVCLSQEMLPDGKTPDEYIADLQRLEQQAISQNRGGWRLREGNEHVSPVKYQTR